MFRCREECKKRKNNLRLGWLGKILQKRQMLLEVVGWKCEEKEPGRALEGKLTPSANLCSLSHVESLSPQGPHVCQNRQAAYRQSKNCVHSLCLWLAFYVQNPVGLVCIIPLTYNFGENVSISFNERNIICQKLCGLLISFKKIISF